MVVAPAPDTVPIQPVEAVLPLLPDAPGPFRDQERIDELLHTAQAALAGNRLALPADNSAYYYYQKFLELDPDNRQARDGVPHIADRYLALAKKAVEKGQHTKAKQYVQLGLSAQSDHPDLVSLDTRLKGPEKKSAPASQRIAQKGSTEQRERLLGKPARRHLRSTAPPCKRLAAQWRRLFWHINNIFR